MMKCKKRVLTLLLALCMLLSLAACGSKDKGDDTQQLSATVYVPEFLSLDLDILGKNYNISGGCTDGTNVYLLAYVYPDYEAGEEGDSRTLLIRFPLDGGEPTEMKNFQSGSSEEDGAEVNRNFNSLRTGIDGSLWLEESTYSYVFDLPEDFDEETDSKYNYTTDTVRKEYQVQLDSTGTEITRIDTSDLQEKAGVEGRYQNGLLVDKDGDIFITDSQKIVVLDSSMNVRFTVEDSNMRGGSLVELSDGSIGATVYVTDAANQSTTAQLRTIDKAAKGWAEKSYDLPLYASYNLYSGGGDYLFYYMNGDALYGYRAEAEEGKPQEQRLLSWLESDINADNISFFSFLSDGRVVVMTESWYGGNDDITLPLLSIGGSGVISVWANVMPRECHDLVMDYLEGRREQAAAAAVKYLPLMNGLFMEGNPIPVKTALNLMGRDVGPFRLPLCEMAPANEARLRALLEEAGLLG